MTVSLLIAFAIGLILLFVLRQLIAGSASDSKVLEAIISGDSVADRYRPMERLLKESDWQYLSSQPGPSASRIRKIRSQRRMIFRRYLKLMVGDFGAICMVVRAMMVQSAVERPDLSATLFKARSRFYFSVLEIHLRLLAHAAGVTSFQIDVSGLTNALDQVCEQLRGLQLSADPTFA